MRLGHVRGRMRWGCIPGFQTRYTRREDDDCAECVLEANVDIQQQSRERQEKKRVNMVKYNPLDLLAHAKDHNDQWGIYSKKDGEKQWWGPLWKFLDNCYPISHLTGISKTINVRTVFGKHDGCLIAIIVICSSAGTCTIANIWDWLPADDVRWQLNCDWTWVYYSSRGRQPSRVDWQRVRW